MERPNLSVEANSPVSVLKSDETSADADPPLFPEVLRCTQGGRVVGRASLEEAYGEAREAQERHELLKALQGMNQQQRLSCCAQLKEKGNAHYAAAEYLPAISCYEQGLLALDLGSSQEQEENVRKQLLLPLLLNLSACLLKLRKYAKASAVCDVIVKEEPQCLKALYRRGIARKELGDLAAAKADFLRILNLCAATPDQQQRRHQQQEREQQQQTQQQLRQQQHETQQQQQQRQQKGTEDHLQADKAQPETSQKRDYLVEEACAAADPSAALCRESRESRGGPSGPSADPNALLVLLCRRELANVNQQQRRYSAACSRMFGGVKESQQQNLPAVAGSEPDKRERDTLRVVLWTTAHRWVTLSASKVVHWTSALSRISLRVCKKRDSRARVKCS
ncbi:hypothetical protein ACSSS7_003603 [Eimeria intestinalis]